jgi:hypothetical protein
MPPIDDTGTDDELSTGTEELSLRDSIAAAFESAGEESEGERITRDRDEGGRFAKRGEADPADAAKPAAQATEGDKPDAATQTTTSTTEQTTETAAPAVQPPAAWSAEAKAEWATLPPKAQAIIAAREAEVHKGFTRLDEERNFGKAMRDTLTPYMANINAVGATPAQAVQSLLNADHILRNGNAQAKTQLLGTIAQQYGVDLSQVVAGAPAPDATVQALQRQVADLSAYINNQAQTAQQSAASKLMSEIESFKADKPHFDTLRPVMASLMESGQANDLQSAYDQAFRAHPTTSQLWLQGEVAKRTTSQADALKAKVDRAKAAAVSVTGSPGANGSQRVQHASLRDELAANLQTAGFRI